MTQLPEEYIVDFVGCENQIEIETQKHCDGVLTRGWVYVKFPFERNMYWGINCPPSNGLTIIPYKKWKKLKKKIKQ